jgi:hypothetical protein
VLPGVAAVMFTYAASVMPAYASGQAGTITSVAFTGGRLLFFMSGTRTGTRPGCDCCSRWEITVGDAYGQALLSIVMTAYAGGRSVSLSGSSSCVSGANDTEGVAYIQSN